MKRITFTRSYENWENNKEQLWLCCEGLDEYFRIPKKVREIDIILSQTKTANSHFVKNNGEYTKIGGKGEEGDDEWLLCCIDDFLDSNYPHGCYVKIQY